MAIARHETGDRRIQRARLFEALIIYLTPVRSYWGLVLWPSAELVPISCP